MARKWKKKKKQTDGNVDILLRGLGMGWHKNEHCFLFPPYPCCIVISMACKGLWLLWTCIAVQRDIRSCGTWNALWIMCFPPFLLLNRVLLCELTLNKFGTKRSFHSLTRPTKMPYQEILPSLTVLKNVIWGFFCLARLLTATSPHYFVHCLAIKQNGDSCWKWVEVGFTFIVFLAFVER